MKLIAETAFHHQGDFEFMKNLVSDISFNTNADIIKLHITLASQEYMLEDHAIFHDIQKWLFNEDQWVKIVELIKTGNKDLMFLFNDTKAVEFGMQFNPIYVEIHSVCLNDIYLLSLLKKHLTANIKVFLGVGGSSLYEIENAINILQHPNIVLMFGFQNYPTKYEDINFAKMRRIMNLFPEFQFGYADHTAWNEPNNTLITLLGAALGMDYIEKHVTTAYGEERIDWSAAVSLDMFNEIKEQLNLLDECNGDGLLRLNKGELDYSVFGPMKKAGIFSKDVNTGQKLDMDMVTFKRTGQVSNMSQTQVLEHIGKRITGDFKKDQVLLSSCFEKGMD